MRFGLDPTRQISSAGGRDSGMGGGAPGGGDAPPWLQPGGMVAVCIWLDARG